MWKDAAAALSLANLCYLRVWRELLTYSQSDMYLMQAPHAPAEYMAAVLNVLLVAAILFLALRQARRPGRNWATLLSKVLVVAALLGVLNGLRSAAGTNYPYLHGELIRQIGLTATLSLIGVLGAAACFALIYWSRFVLRIAWTVPLILSPFVLFTFAQAFSAALKPAPPGFAPKPLAPFLDMPQRTRVLWVIFDEMDQRLAFSERQPGLCLPEFDRFRAAALQATAAESPSRDTLSSIPSSITGRRVYHAWEAGPSQLLVTFSADNTPRRWGSGSNIFALARGLGVNSAVAGWYHPYCRIFNDSLSACASDVMANQANSMGSGLLQVLLNQSRSLLETSLISPFGQSLVVKHHVRSYRHILDSAKAFSVDRRLGLVLVHLPVPHTPYIYNPRDGRLDLKNAVLTYTSGLLLADKSLGDLRLALENAGLWSQTTILVTSDHPYRDATAYDGKPVGKDVPFLLKFAGRDQAAVYDRPFNTVLIHDLLLAILKGDVSSSADAIRWLDTAANRQPSGSVDRPARVMPGVAPATTHSAP